MEREREEVSLRPPLNLFFTAYFSHRFQRNKGDEWREREEEDEEEETTYFKQPHD